MHGKVGSQADHNTPPTQGEASPETDPPPEGASSSGGSGGRGDREPGAADAMPMPRGSSDRLFDNLPGPRRRLPVAPSLGRLVGNRDWTILIECRKATITVYSTTQQFETAALQQRGSANPLADAVRKLVDRRQATVAPGEPPYRPVLQFKVYPDGLRTYYLAFGLLEPLNLATTRENMEVPQHPIPDLGF
jgi:hypothetical protein